MSKQTLKILKKGLKLLSKLIVGKGNIFGEGKEKKHMFDYHPTLPQDLFPLFSLCENLTSRVFFRATIRQTC